MTRETAEERMPDASFSRRVVGDSRVVQFARRIGDQTTLRLDDAWAFVEHSALYEWLTKEPEPDVIVIDLRETYTVGPFIRLLDAVVDRAMPYWEASTVKRIVDAVVDVGVRASETRAGKVVAAVLAPPAPPEDARSASNGAVDDARSASTRSVDDGRVDGGDESGDGEDAPGEEGASGEDADTDPGRDRDELD